MNRRRVIKGSVALLGAGGLGFLVTTENASASVQATFDATNVQTTTHDGEIESVTIAPTGKVTWFGLDDEPTDGVVGVAVRDPNDDDSEWTQVASNTISVSGLEGETDYRLPDSPSQGSNSRIDLTEGPFDDAHFKAPAGEKKTTPVDVRITATIEAAVTRTATVSDNFDVVVENAEASVTVSGSANSGVSSDSEVDSS